MSLKIKKDIGYLPLPVLISRQITIKDYPHENDDEDVEKERKRVLEGGSADDIVRVENMTKVYHSSSRQIMFSCS